MTDSSTWQEGLGEGRQCKAFGSIGGEGRLSLLEEQEGSWSVVGVGECE